MARMIFIEKGSPLKRKRDKEKSLTIDFLPPPFFHINFLTYSFIIQNPIGEKKSPMRASAMIYKIITSGREQCTVM